MKKEKYIEINSEDLIYLLNTFEFMKFYVYNMVRKTLLPYLGFKDSGDRCLLAVTGISDFDIIEAHQNYKNKQIKKYLEANERTNYAYKLLEKASLSSYFTAIAEDIKTKVTIELYYILGMSPTLYQDRISYRNNDIEQINQSLTKIGCLNQNKPIKIKNQECLYKLIDVLEEFYTNIIAPDVKEESFSENIKNLIFFPLPTPSTFDKEKIQSILENKEKTNKINVLFDCHGKVLEKYVNTSLENYDFSNVNFDGKNISNLKIRNNPTIKINFDKIVKDISNCDFFGYDLKKVTFKNFNLQNTDLRNTSATIDLATCSIATEGKMNPGTLFDENNKFIFGGNKLSQEDVKKLGIKIYKREM